MAKDVENVNGAAAEAPAVKKHRRGVSNQTQAVAQLRFHEKDAAPNGLFVAHLHKVSVEWSTNGDGKQFTGMKVPRLVFEFCSNTANPAETRHVFNSLFPVESNVNTIPDGIEEWKVTSVMRWIKHVLDIYYLKGRELTEEECDALTLPFEDFDEDGNYVSVDPQTVVDGYAYIFNNAAAMLNGTFNLPDGATPKSYLRDENGKYLRCWIKLLRCKKVKNQWRNVTPNGDLGFDSFTGSGAIELMPRPDAKPLILNFDASKESITPKEVSKEPTVPGMVPGMGGVMAGGAAVLGAPASQAFADAADDMPF